MNLPPAEIGASIEDIDTPALIVDLDALDRNIAKMADCARMAGVRVRPHAKTHKSAAIALRQIAQGAVGQCVQKVGEAEALVRGGVKDILVSNQVVGERKLRRLAALATDATVALCFDCAEQVDAASRIAKDFGVEFGALVEIEVGMERCGIAPGKPAAALARRIADAPNLKFRGLQAYHGRAQHLPTHQQRAQAIASADYAKIGNKDGGLYTAFEHSLFVLASVISTPAADRAIVDAGLKSYSGERGSPWVHGREDVQLTNMSDEHGKLVLGPKAKKLNIGEKIWLIPGHCDPTVNLHDWYAGVRNGRVEALWPISARGAST